MIGEDSLVLSMPKKTLREYFIQKKRHLSAGKLYKLKDKFILSLFYFSKIVFWLLAALLIFPAFHIEMILGGIILMMILLTATIKKVGKKTGAEFEFEWIVIMDIIFVFYLLIIGTSALISKRIRWS